MENKYSNSEILSAKQILQKLLNYTGESINSLANTIGLKRSQNLYDIDNGKVKNISFELAEKISTSYPKINKEWLRTGKGEMILHENFIAEAAAPSYKNHSKPLTEAEGIEFLKQHIETLKQNDAWIKKMFETNLASADSDRLAIMAQLKNLNVLAAEIFAAGDKKKYDLKMKEYRKALGAVGDSKT